MPRRTSGHDAVKLTGADVGKEKLVGTDEGENVVSVERTSRQLCGVEGRSWWHIAEVQL